MMATGFALREGVPKHFSHGEKEGPTPPGPRRSRGPPGAGSEAWEDEGVGGRPCNPSPSQPLRGRAPPSPSGRGVPYRPAGAAALNHPSLAVGLPNGDVLLNDDANHRVIVVDPRTNQVVWQYGVTGRPGSTLGFLNNPDGIQGHNFATQIAHVEDRRVLQGRLTMVRYNNEPQFFVADASVFLGLVADIMERLGPYLETDAVDAETITRLKDAVAMVDRRTTTRS